MQVIKFEFGGDIPSLNSKAGLDLFHKVYHNWKANNKDWSLVPEQYKEAIRNYSQGEEFGSHVIQGTEKTSKTLLPLMFGPATIAAAGIPQIGNVLNLAGVADGVRNLISKSGISKTLNHLKNKEYGEAALSGLGDAFDISGVLGVGKGINKLTKKAVLNSSKTFNDLRKYMNYPSDLSWREIKAMKLADKAKKRGKYLYNVTRHNFEFEPIPLEKAEPVPELVPWTDIKLKPIPWPDEELKYLHPLNDRNLLGLINNALNTSVTNSVDNINPQLFINHVKNLLAELLIKNINPLNLLKGMKFPVKIDDAQIKRLTDIIKRNKDLYDSPFFLR